MKKKTPSLHDIAVRLCEGGVVDYGGYALRAKEVETDDSPCLLCEMDCVCDYDMTNLCAECDGVTRSKHIIYFANKQK